MSTSWCSYILGFFFFQAEDGIRDLVRSRGLGDVYKRQDLSPFPRMDNLNAMDLVKINNLTYGVQGNKMISSCLLYTSDAADERSSVDLGGRRIIKKKKNVEECVYRQALNINTDGTST